eukprot:jgi/Psemu1/7029/gm1.7029_g
MLTYSEYFQATARLFESIPANQDSAYTTIYGFFADNAPLLLDRLLDLFEAQAVGALGIFVANTIGESHLRLVHGLRKYPGPLAQTSANKGKAFGYLDEIEGDAGELVQVDSDMLAQTPATLVLALCHHVTELDAPRHPSYLIPMVLGGDAHTEVVSAYKAFFILFELRYTPLFDTLRAAGTVPSIIAGDLTLIKPSPSFWSELGFPMYMKSKVLYRDLPGLNRLPTIGDPALTTAMAALTDHQLRLTPVAALWKARRSRPPPIYQAWTQKSKHKKTHMIFQSQVASCASELFIQAPLVTIAELKRFQYGNFYGTDPFDTLKREQEAAANVAAYDTVISIEGNSFTLEDSRELHKTKAYIPLTGPKPPPSWRAIWRKGFTARGFTAQMLLSPAVCRYVWAQQTKGPDSTAYKNKQQDGVPGSTSSSTA